MWEDISHGSAYYNDVNYCISQAAYHCCKAHAKIYRKIENSTPCEIVTHEDFNLKLGTRDYVAEATHHATLRLNRPSVGFPPNSGNITLV